MNPEEFRTAVLEMGLALDEKQMAQYARYYELLVEWNEKSNMSAPSSIAPIRINLV